MLKRDTLCSRRRSMAGISLVESLVYIAVFAVITGFAFVTLHRFYGQSHALRRNAESIAMALRAGERWRADVRLATGPVIAEEEAGRISIPRNDGTVAYYLEEGRLWRKAPEKPREPILDHVESVQLTRDQRDRVTAMHLDLELKRRAEKVNVEPLFRFTAVPGMEVAP